MFLEENKAIVRRYQEIYNSNHLDVLSEVLSEELLTRKFSQVFLMESKAQKPHIKSC